MRHHAPLCAATGAAVLAFALNAGAAAAALLPPVLAPPAPFPLVLGQSLEREFVAPGVERAAYRLQTSAGPLVISLVTFDPREPTLRLGTVLARDRIVSNGETISSMAARTGAARRNQRGLFRIGNTNTPLGVLAQNGALVRTPSSRTALTIGHDRSVRFETYRFHGTATANGTNAIPIGAVNEWPPHDGAALLTPAFGLAPACAQCVVAELVPVPTPDAPAAPPGGRYRVTQIDTGTAPAQPGFALGLGPAAQSAVETLPDVGDLIDVALDTDPPRPACRMRSAAGLRCCRTALPWTIPLRPATPSVRGASRPRRPSRCTTAVWRSWWSTAGGRCSRSASTAPS